MTAEQVAVNRGIQEGLQKGVRKGRQEGVNKTAYRFAIKMLATGEFAEKVAGFFDLPLEQVLHLTVKEYTDN